MRATTLAHSREVSTSSAATTHCGGFLASTESGNTEKRAPRAPANSAGPRLFAPAFGSASFIPMCESSPASMQMWTRSAISGRELRPRPGPRPTSRAASRSWPCTSCHSRTRR